MKQRIGEDRMPPAQNVVCSHCDRALPIAKAAAWPLIVILDKRDRTASYDALGLCGCDEHAHTVPVTAESEPLLF